MMGCLTGAAMVIWFLVWVTHGTPYLLEAWNPWNVSLLVLALFLVLVRIPRHSRSA